MAPVSRYPTETPPVFLSQPEKAVPSQKRRPALWPRMPSLPEPAASPPNWASTAQRCGAAAAVAVSANAMCVRRAGSAAARRRSPSSGIRKRSPSECAKARHRAAPVTLTTTRRRDRIGAAAPPIRRRAGEPGVRAITDFFVKLAAVALQQHPARGTGGTGDRVLLPADPHWHRRRYRRRPARPGRADVPPSVPERSRVRSRDLIEQAPPAANQPAQEMQRRVFTVTNLGMFGIDAFTPISTRPNAPSSASAAIRHVSRFRGRAGASATSDAEPDVRSPHRRRRPGGAVSAIAGAQRETLV